MSEPKITGASVLTMKIKLEKHGKGFCEMTHSPNFETTEKTERILQGGSSSHYVNFVRHYHDEKSFHR